MTTTTFPYALVFPEYSRHTKLPLFILCTLFGIFGVHRFYAQKFGTGLLQLITLGGCGLWVLVDLALICSGKFTDEMGFPIRRWR